jgi:ketosteroid isomerase-like protein
MNDVERVCALNAIFDRYDFAPVRDAVEGSSTERVSSGIDELDALVRDSIAPDVVVEFHGGTGLPEGDRYEGLAGYLRFWRAWLAAFDEYQLEHDDYRVVGDSVVVSVVHRGRGRGSGLAFELPQGQRWVLRGGRVAEIHVHASHAEALRASE